MTSFDPSKVQGKTIHLVQLTQEFKLHLLTIKSKTLLCSKSRVLNKAESGRGQEKIGFTLPVLKVTG